MFVGVLNIQARMTVAEKLADAAAWFALNYGHLPDEALISQIDLDTMAKAGEKPCVPCRVPKDRTLETGAFWLGPIC